MIDIQAGVADPSIAICGEGPLWDAARGLLWWVDIAGERVHRLDPASGALASFDMPLLVSSLAHAPDGKLLIATLSGLQMMKAETGALLHLHDPEPSDPNNRLNDMKPDAQGRLWAGTMSIGAAAPSGALYRYGADGSVELADAMTITNGMDWSPDGKTFYLVDSVPGQVYAYDFDATSGAIENRRVLAAFDPETGKPDGMCVDAEGTIWVAVCDAGRVDGFAPDGSLRGRVSVPAKRITSCAYGGADLHTLFITSGCFGLSEAELAQYPLSGALFSAQMPTGGKLPNVAQWPSLT